MPTIIDALVVTLTLDAASFQRSTQQVGKRLDEIAKNLRKTGEAGEQMGLSAIKGAEGAGLALRGLTQSFAALPLAAVAAAAAVAVAFMKITAEINKADRQILNLSRTTDIPPERINAIGAVAERYFGSREGAQTSAARLTGKLQQLRMGTLDADDPLIQGRVRWGIDTAGSGAAQVATTDELRNRVIADMHRRAMQGTQGRLQAQQEGEYYGIDAGTIQAAIASQNYEAEIQRQEELARVTPEGLKSSEGFGQSLTDLKNAWDGLMREMVEPIEKSLTPAIVSLTGYVKQFGDWYAKIDWDKLGVFFTEKLPQLNKALQEIAGYEWGRMKDAFLWLFEKIDKLLGTNLSETNAATAEQEQYQPTSTTGEAWARFTGAGRNMDATPQSAGVLAEPIRKALMDRGITNPDSQDALLGVLYNESGLIPGRFEEGGGPGRGLAQITTQKRKDWYQNFLGMPVEQASAYDQTRAIIAEMQANYPEVYQILMDPNKSRDEKVRAITRTFESPANPGERVVKDQGRAAQFSEPYYHPAPAPPPAPKPKPQNDPGLRPQLPFYGWNQQADGARQYAMLDGNMSAANSNISSVNFNGGMVIHSAATDAAGLARDIHGALQNQFGNPQFMALPANGVLA